MNWFDMGHHTFYVWLAYGVSFVALIGISLNSLRQKRQVLKRLTKQFKRKQLENLE